MNSEVVYLIDYYIDNVKYLNSICKGKIEGKKIKTIASFLIRYKIPTLGLSFQNDPK